MLHRIEHVNTGFFIVAILMAVYIIALPFFNEASYWAYHFFGPRTYTFTTEGSHELTDEQIAGEAVSVAPDQNMLVIPEIGVNGQIYEGKSVSVLDKGIWRRPNSSTPDRGSNTVLVAHRFLYRSGPNTFYNLNKVKVGDEFYIWWDNKRYTYKISEVTTVPPEDVEIEGPSKDAMVTLYTCTLITASNRLVVRAMLEGVQ